MKLYRWIYNSPDFGEMVIKVPFVVAKLLEKKGFDGALDNISLLPESMRAQTKDFLRYLINTIKEIEGGKLSDIKDFFGLSDSAGFFGLEKK